MFLKKNDTIQVMKGKDRGKRGKILTIFPVANKATIEGLNLAKKHARPRRRGEKGQLIQIPMPISISNLKLVCNNCGNPARISHRIEGDIKLRICKKCGSIL